MCDWEKFLDADDSRNAVAIGVAATCFVLVVAFLASIF